MQNGNLTADTKVQLAKVARRSPNPYPYGTSKIQPMKMGRRAQRGRTEDWHTRKQMLKIILENIQMANRESILGTDVDMHARAGRRERNRFANRKTNFAEPMVKMYVQRRNTESRAPNKQICKLKTLKRTGRANQQRLPTCRASKFASVKYCRFEIRKRIGQASQPPLPLCRASRFANVKHGNGKTERAEPSNLRTRNAHRCTEARERRHTEAQRQRR